VTWEAFPCFCSHLPAAAVAVQKHMPLGSGEELHLGAMGLEDGAQDFAIPLLVLLHFVDGIGRILLAQFHLQPPLKNQTWRFASRCKAEPLRLAQQTGPLVLHQGPGFKNTVKTSYGWPLLLQGAETV